MGQTCSQLKDAHKNFKRESNEQRTPKNGDLEGSTLDSCKVPSTTVTLFLIDTKLVFVEIYNLGFFRVFF